MGKMKPSKPTISLSVVICAVFYTCVVTSINEDRTTSKITGITPTGKNKDKIDGQNTLQTTFPRTAPTTTENIPIAKDQERNSSTTTGNVESESNVLLLNNYTQSTRTDLPTVPGTLVKHEPTETITLPPLPSLPTLLTMWVTFSEVVVAATAVMKGPNVLERSNRVLSAHITQEFLSNFTNNLQVRVISQQLQFCPYRPLCTFSWPDTIQLFSNKLCCESCRCDAGCKDTMTCCPNIIPESSYHLNYSKQYKRCVSSSLLNGNLGTYAFNDCPENTNIALQRNCTRLYNDANDLLITDTLVTEDKHQNRYRNIYCALCNNVPRDNLTFWKPQISCKNDTTESFISSDNILQSVFDTPGCDILFLPLVHGTDEECEVAITQCNETGLWLSYDAEIEWACSMYSSPLEAASGRFYQNVFCMLCNGDNEVNSLCSIFDASKFVEKFSFSAVLNVETHQQSAGIDSSRSSCSTGFIKAEIDCVPAYCSILRKLEGENCVRSFESVTSNYYRSYFRIIPFEYLSTETALKSMRTILTQFIDYIRYIIGAWIQVDKVDCLIQTDIIFPQNMSSIQNHSSVDFFDILVKFELNLFHDPEAILNNFKDSDRITFFISHLDFLEISCYVILKDDTGLLFSELDITNTRSRIEAFVLNIETYIQNNTILTLESDNGAPLSDSNVNDKKTILPFVLPSYGSNEHDNREGINLASMLACPLVNVSLKIYNWQLSRNGIFFPHENIYLNFSDFIYAANSEDTISVCLEAFVKIRGNSTSVMEDPGQPMTTESVVSLCCVSLSILSLLFTILTIACLPGFDTTPWKNNLCLVVSLLCAQVLYLVASNANFVKRSTVCKIVGVVLHFSLLMSIAWMNICTFHMFRILTSNKLIANTKRGLTYFTYFLYSMVVPFLLVLTNILYSLGKSGWTDVGYGEVICYMNSQIMVLLTFGLPLAFVVVTNMGMFWMVMRRIKATPKIRKNVKNERNLIIICAKLSIITGLTWVIGLIHMFTNIVVFSYIFIVLNGSQGVFLMISFVCNRKVLEIYKSGQFRVSSSTS